MTKQEKDTLKAILLARIYGVNGVIFDKNSEALQAIAKGVTALVELDKVETEEQ